MGNWNNLRPIEVNDDVIYAQEIEAFLTVFDELLERLGLTDAAGAFVLYSQAYGDDTCERDPVMTVEIGNQHHAMDADIDLANTSVQEVLKWPDQDSRFWRHFRAGTIQRAEQCYPVTRIYREGELMTLAVNAAYGRFLASLVLRRDNAELDMESCEEILRALAVAIARLSPQDEFLQSTVEEEIVSGDITPPIQYVHELFDECKLSALRAWKDWTGINHGEVNTLFFR